ncbi:hypothetical protein LguiA_015032 [Lonicera macranthoides]
MNTITTTFLIAFLLTTSPLSLSTRPDSPGPTHAQRSTNNSPGGSGNNNGQGGFFGPGGGWFNIPGFGVGWGNGIIGGGFGSGYGSPNGGSSQGGVISPTVVCNVEGPCYNKKLTCPAKCFTSFSRSGSGGGGGGGGGGCAIDCTNKCVAYC